MKTKKEVEAKVTILLKHQDENDNRYTRYYSHNMADELRDKIAALRWVLDQCKWVDDWK